LKIIQRHIVPDNVEDIRLYDYAPKIFSTIPSRKGIKKAISRGEITIDGEKSSTGTWIKAGQKIELLDSEINPPKSYKLDFDVVYEDEFFAVINKPSGIPVSGNQYRTIQNALIGRIRPSIENDALKWSKPVHRLDGPTSGLLLIAKTASALVKLGQQFQSKEIEKRYRAIVIGKMPEKGIIDREVDGLPAVTKFNLIDTVPSLKNTFLSLVDLYPKTGRTHQLRIHLSKMGYPIMGDKIYGKKDEVLKGKGLFLCAVTLKFSHPITNKPIQIEIPEPNKFSSLLERENRRWNKYNK